MMMGRTFAEKFALVWLSSILAAGVVSAQSQLEEASPLPESLLPSNDWTKTYQQATDQVLVSVRSASPFLRANAIEAIQAVPRRSVPVIQLAFDDPHPVVRFSALTLMGRLKIRALAPAARRFLNDPSKSVQGAAMFALHQCGDESGDITPLAGMLASQNPSLRGNAAMLLGYLGDPSAVLMLKDLARVPMPRVSAVQESIVRIQVAEALVRLGDTQALNALRAGAYSQFDEVRVLAVSMMGELGDQRMEKAFATMLIQPPIELQIAAAGALARFGRHEGFAVVMEATFSSMTTVRAQATLTLEYFHRHAQARTALEQLLDDPEEQVRLAAAAAILRIHQPTR